MEFHLIRLWLHVASIIIPAFICICSSTTSTIDKGHEVKLPYMTTNVTEIEGKSFDYIIVGGGACGCSLAATLSDKFSILVIERGGSPYGDLIISQRSNYGFSLLKTNKFSSATQAFTSLDGVPNLRGRILGGSTAINGGFYSRASAKFVKKMGWNANLVKKAYEWVESQVVFPPILSNWQSTIMNGLLEAGILPFNGYTLEHVQGTKMSGTIFDAFGKRHSAADLLAGGNHENITVLLNATVSKVIFQKDGDKPRAIGVNFIKSEGNDTKNTYKVHLKKTDNSAMKGEVMLSAGALSSPQILMLSGIGPPSQLQKFDIPIVVNIQGVGKKMQDPPSISHNSKPQWRMPDPPQVVGIAKDNSVIESGILPISSNSTIVFIAGKIAFPASRGELELKNKDPRENPSVKFNYFAENEDLEACVKLHGLVQQVAKTNWVSEFLGENHTSFVKLGDEESRELCKKNVRTFYHYHGGCVVGLVVDEKYKVYGVKGLRVIDGSTLVESPGTNPMATLMMLGRYQGLKIVEDRTVSSV